MKKLLVDRLLVCLLVLAAVCLLTWSTPASAEIWQILPFPDNNWPGSRGEPATTNGNVVTLYGRPVRTLQTFSGPLRISYDVILQARTTDDGSFNLSFVPPGLSTNLDAPNFKVVMEYRNGAADDLLINQNNQGILWTVPFSISSQTVYHVALDLSASGQLTWMINSLTNSIPNTVTMPYTQFQVQLAGWQPGDVWQVSNFAVVPEPSTAMLAALGMGLLAAIRRHKSR